MRLPGAVYWWLVRHTHANTHTKYVCDVLLAHLKHILLLEISIPFTSVYLWRPNLQQRHCIKKTIRCGSFCFIPITTKNKHKVHTSLELCKSSASADESWINSCSWFTEKLWAKLTVFRKSFRFLYVFLMFPLYMIESKELRSQAGVTERHFTPTPHNKEDGAVPW